MAADEYELFERVHKHAWEWFELHAKQRMQTFNHFLIGTAFLIAAYGALLDKHMAVAGIVALVGVLFAIWFMGLDSRTKELIEAGQDALRITQERLARRVFCLADLDAWCVGSRTTLEQLEVALPIWRRYETRIYADL